MKPFSLHLLVALLLLAGPALAQNPGSLKVKNRSTYNAIDLPRNPFWPIGFNPNAKVDSPVPVAQVPLRAAVKPEDFNLTSISSFQGARMAMLSGKPVMEGELVNLTVSGQKTKVQIVTVTDGAVVLRCLGQEVTVQLKRPEMNLNSGSKDPVIRSREE